MRWARKPEAAQGLRGSFRGIRCGERGLGVLVGCVAHTRAVLRFWLGPVTAGEIADASTQYMHALNLVGGELGGWCIVAAVACAWTLHTLRMSGVWCHLLPWHPHAWSVPGTTHCEASDGWSRARGTTAQSTCAELNSRPGALVTPMLWCAAVFCAALRYAVLCFGVSRRVV